ncbi:MULTISPECIES: pyruvate, phosphate dikinase [Novosphingobium]|uniref:Pyruvate, phosphate dikinase n=2 Tax=Novosphingobium TaxID=165696 RepID=A0ABQ2JZN1_9SPHN|nr:MULTISPECIES: pyruvate, phosphate dikinase [Novosphingobium]MCT2401755.1 pyruvate, phosphate dikinase [Novosphingobium mangrovi (ex Huang et al. 2023)]GGN59419.1 pyruvate, phosphate dikinase [Novosphingobium indicum]
MSSVFSFGSGVLVAGQIGLDKRVLGGKGANLAEMARIGLPVPPGFTISAGECLAYLDHGRASLDRIRDEVSAALGLVERATGKTFGNPRDPLLVSVRSGARVSMPGMMDTILNLGINDATVTGLGQSSGDERFALDSYRRFIQMYSSVVLEIEHGVFEAALDRIKEDRGVDEDIDLRVEDLRGLIATFKDLVLAHHGAAFPQDVQEQLWTAIEAVFRSWDSPRAKVYRRLNDIPGDWGTAVNVQAMVFGNLGETSATGVAFTRNPATGEKAYYGEWLANAQGEDVVAGIRTPQYLTRAAREAAGARLPSMQEAMPKAYAQLAEVFELLERHYRDMQDIEFTVERGRLYLLQTRSGKRTAKAALKIAVDMVEESLVDEVTALLRLDPASLDQLLHPSLDPNAPRVLLGKGLPASPGAASGGVVFDAETAARWAELGEKVILVRHETSPDDIHGMHVATGILTARGGMTSHAAVVARGMGRPCVAGTASLKIDPVARVAEIGGQRLEEGAFITIDGSTGEVFLGELPTILPKLSGDFATVMAWADKHRRLKIRTNAETPLDCEMARRFGAEGVGLCRTEHMFFDESRILAMRQMILADSEKERRSALDQLLPEQRADFRRIFEIMEGLPVTIRLLDPPLHEFLPHTDSEFTELSRAMGIDVEQVRHRAIELAETNPMLGHRGCRLGVVYPEIYEMQARAIFEAALEVAGEAGMAVCPEIMIPLVGLPRELESLKDTLYRVAEVVFAEKGERIAFSVGTMIELPRAALVADEIAASGEFFSFGTNDLTQTTLGISRDDAARFLGAYVEKGIIAKDPFVTLDIEGVGKLIEMASRKGRETRPDLKLGICGEHGGDPATIAFCEEIGLDYVSASPFRVPIARLAAAQAALAPS